MKIRHFGINVIQINTKSKWKFYYLKMQHIPCLRCFFERVCNLRLVNYKISVPLSSSLPKIHPYIIFLSKFCGNRDTFSSNYKIEKAGKFKCCSIVKSLVAIEYGAILRVEKLPYFILKLAILKPNL